MRSRYSSLTPGEWCHENHDTPVSRRESGGMDSRYSSLTPGERWHAITILQSHAGRAVAWDHDTPVSRRESGGMGSRYSSLTPAERWHGITILQSHARRVVPWIHARDSEALPPSTPTPTGLEPATAGVHVTPQTPAAAMNEEPRAPIGAALAQSLQLSGAEQLRSGVSDRG